MTPEPSAADIYGRDFPAGAVVFEEGDPGSRMYVIQSGEVRILKIVSGREIELARLTAGEAFGEMALLEGQPRSATAVVALPADEPGARAASGLDEYLALRRRFDPEDRGRKAP